YVLVARADPAVVGQPLALGADLREVEDEPRRRGVLVDGQLADRPRPRLGRVAHGERPRPGRGVEALLVARPALLARLLLRADDLHLPDRPREARQRADNRLKADAATVEQQPQEVHEVVDGLDLRRRAGELRGLADL